MWPELTTHQVERQRYKRITIVERRSQERGLGRTPWIFRGSAWRLWFPATGAGAAVAFVGIFTHGLIHRHNLSVLYQHGTDAIQGGIAGCLLLVILHKMRERRRAFYARLDVISDMNHHINNALQVLTGLQYTEMGTEEAKKMCTEALERITFALREILPQLPAVSADKSKKKETFAD